MINIDVLFNINVLMYLCIEVRNVFMNKLSVMLDIRLKVICILFLLKVDNSNTRYPDYKICETDTNDSHSQNNFGLTRRVVPCMFKPSTLSAVGTLEIITSTPSILFDVL